MNAEHAIEADTLEIADLEYEVGGMNAEEPTDARSSFRNSIVIVITQE
jgi:hypothetical protein